MSIGDTDGGSGQHHLVHEVVTPGLRAVALHGFVRSLVSITSLPSDVRVASWSRQVSAATRRTASSEEYQRREHARSSSVDSAEMIAATGSTLRIAGHIASTICYPTGTVASPSFLPQAAEARCPRSAGRRDASW
jgi:hypothetical protein